MLARSASDGGSACCIREWYGASSSCGKAGRVETTDKEKTLYGKPSCDAGTGARCAISAVHRASVYWASGRSRRVTPGTQCPCTRQLLTVTLARAGVGALTVGSGVLCTGHEAAHDLFQRPAQPQRQ
jgi:hypothetical protein